MLRFKRGMRGVAENAEQRDELVDGLQYRIHKERDILNRRLAREEPQVTKKRGARSRKTSKTRRTGKLYQVFQALSYDEES